ncbi:MAG: carbohydrate binding domain-containing protein [Eubacteriales bacterium]|nr:carbohydrate binding domain-containing protein [Eubacteriales bacterium]
MRRIISTILSVIIILTGTHFAFAEGDVRVFAPQFSGSGINSFGGIQKGEINTVVTIDNAADKDLDAMLIGVVAQRDSNKIVDVSICAEKVLLGKNKDFSIKNIIPDDKLYSLKILCWDKGMNNLTAPITIEDYNTDLHSFNPPTLLTGFDTDEASSMFLWADTEYGGSIDATTAEDGYSNSALRLDYNRQHYGCQAQKIIDDDWSKYSGLIFYVKGTENSVVYARINDGAKTWQKTINPSANWDKVEVDFSDFDGINLSSIKSLTFFIHSNGAANRSGEGYFMVDSIFLTSPVRTTFVSQILSKELGSCYTDEDVTLYGEVCNFNNPSKDYVIKGDIRDMDGNVVAEISQEITLGSTQILPTPINIKVKPYGNFMASISVNGSVFAQKEFTRIPLLDNKKISNQYKQGYSIHFDSLKTDKQIIDEADMMKRGGASIIRQDFLWDKIEPDDNGYYWSFYDKVVNILTERDIEVLGLITYSNKQNSSIEDYNGIGKGMYRRYPPVNLERWGKYVYDTVSRYKGTISKWEMWNEANIFFWEQDPAITNNVDYYRAIAYLPLLKVSYLAAKAADPDCTVTMSGMSDIGVGFVNNLLEQGGKDYFDVLNIHPYMAKSVEETDSWSDRNFEKKIVHTRNKAPDLPIYVTEWGWNTNKGTTLKDSAIWNTKGIIYSRVTGAQANTLYSFNILTDNGFGYVQPSVNGYAKPQFGAVTAANYLLGSYDCVGVIEKNGSPAFGTDTFGAYFEKDGDKPILSVWLTNENISKQMIKVKTTSPIVVYDMYGNGKTIYPTGDTAIVYLDKKPVYIKGDLEGYTEYSKPRFVQEERVIQDIKSVVQARCDYYLSTERILKQGETYKLKIRVVNYSGKNISGIATISGIDEKWLSNKNLNYNIENGKSQILYVDITPDSVTSGQKYSLTVADNTNENFESMIYYFKGE